jgi:hypothetical protein
MVVEAVIASVVPVALVKSNAVKCDVEDAWSPAEKKIGVEVELAAAP